MKKKDNMLNNEFTNKKICKKNKITNKVKKLIYRFNNLNYLHQFHCKCIHKCNLQHQ